MNEVEKSVLVSTLESEISKGSSDKKLKEEEDEIESLL
jgi:hypothetical protein